MTNNTNNKLSRIKSTDILNKTLDFLKQLRSFNVSQPTIKILYGFVISNELALLHAAK